MKFLIVLLISAAGIAANERHFTYAYETAVLPPNVKEVELWSTLRTGRDLYFARLENRAEFEWGLTEKLQTSFYFNWKNESALDTAAGAVVSGFEFQGISSEWKYKLMDPVADPVGLALYAELGYNTNEFEVEAKVLADKKTGKFLTAFNIVGEFEYEAEAESASTEVEMELEEIGLEMDLGVSYSLSNSFSAGLELRNHSVFLQRAEKWELEFSPIFLGPVLSYAREGWWATLTILPQISKELDDHEKINTRLLFSFHI